MLTTRFAIGVPGVSAAWGMLLVIGVAATLGAQTEQPRREESWKGEKVRLSPLPPGRSPFKFIGGDGSCVRPENDRKASLLAADYAGRDGIVASVTRNEYNSASLIVELDGTGERVAFSSCGHDALAFHSEHTRAQALVGKTVWSRGAHDVTPPEEWEQSIGLRKTFQSGNLEPLIVTGVRWGFGPTPARPVVICVRNATGREGCFLEARGISDGRQYVLDPRYATEYNAIPVTEILYLTDPRASHKAWSADTWRLIQSSRIAVGMSLDMAELACGTKLLTVGALLDDKGNASDIVTCPVLAGRFVLKGGKIASDLGR